MEKLENVCVQNKKPSEEIIIKEQVEEVMKKISPIKISFSSQKKNFLTPKTAEIIPQRGINLEENLNSQEIYYDNSVQIQNLEFDETKNVRGVFKK